jgi:Ca2+-binding RTX toxin-like protein
MNMISTGSFLTDASASEKQKELVRTLTTAWEKKNSKAARSGGVSLMALSLAACGSSEDTTPYSADDLAAKFDEGVASVDITSDNEAVAATARAEGVASVDITTDNEAVAATARAEGVASVDITTDNAQAVSLALRDAAANLGVSNTVSMTDAELITAIKTANDAAVSAAVDVTSDNASAVTAALKAAADDLGVTGTASMSNAELITAIKTANDAAVQAAVDLTSNDTAAINAAVAADTSFATLAELVEAYNALANPATYVLTTGVNNFTGSAIANSFDASTVNSLSNGDTLDGGDGADTLTATLNGLTLSVNSTSIETFNVTALTGASTLNMTSVSGLNTINVVSSNTDITFNNMQSVGTLGLNTSAADTVTLNFSNASMASAADDLLIDLDGSTATTVALTSAAGATNTIETVSIDSGSVSNSLADLQTTGVGATTLEVTGDTDLTITAALDNEITTVSASSFTGGLTMTAGTGGVAVTTGSGADDITGGAGDDIIITGAGADTVTATAGGDDTINTGAGDDEVTAANNIAASDTVTGGDGTDTLNFGANAADLSAAALAGVSEFEIVEVNGAITVTVDTDAVTAAGGSITINETGADANVTVSAAVAAGSSVILGEANAFTLANVDGNRVTIADEADNDADGLVSDESTETVTLSTTNTGSIVTGSASQDTIVAQSSGTAAHNVSLGGGDDEVTAANTIAADDTFVGGDGTDTLNFGANAANITGLTLVSEFEVIEVNGAQTVTVNTANVTAAGGSITINETGADANVTVSAAVAAGSSVILGEANAFILADAVANRVTIEDEADNDADGLVSDESTETVTLGTGDNIVTGSASQDTVVLNSGTNTVNLGGGDDQFNTTDANLDGFNVLNGGDGTDTIQMVSDAGADTIVDNDFSFKTSIEALTLVNNGNTVTIDTKAAAMGLTTVTGGTGADSLTANSGFTNNLTFDGSANGTYTVDVSATSGTLSYTGSTGVDTLSTGSGAATITGGGGTDVITIGTGAVTYTGGAAVDTIVIENGDLNAADTLTGATGTDVIQTSGAVTLVDADFTNVATFETLEASTNDGALTFTGGALATAAGIVTIDSGDGADIINASAMTGTLAINGAAGNDTITGGSGSDTITAGAGNDTIIITDADPDTNVQDNVIFNASGTNGQDTITGYESGVDILEIEDADTSAATASNANAVVEAINASASLVVAAAFNLETASAGGVDASDVFELLGTNAGNGDLSLATDGSELFKLLGVDGSAATAITVGTAGDAAFLVAYDNGNAYLYSMTEDGTNTAVVASEITLMATIENVSVGGLDTGDFVII